MSGEAMNYSVNYRSKKYQPGTVHATNDFGPFIILGRMDDAKCDLYAVEFLSTGYTTKARTSSIKKGMVKDYHVPTMYGRGFLGTGKHFAKVSGKTSRQYKLWTGMFYRCYSGATQHKSYKGVEVSERWFNYQVFCEDIKLLEGYSAWLNGYGMSLDKDTKYNGTYSVDSCVFITKSENSRESAIRNNLADAGKDFRFTPAST